MRATEEPQEARPRGSEPQEALVCGMRAKGKLWPHPGLGAKGPKRMGCNARKAELSGRVPFRVPGRAREGPG